MSAHVLLNLLNELGKRYKMRGLVVVRMREDSCHFSERT